MEVSIFIVPIFLRRLYTFLIDHDSPVCLGDKKENIHKKLYIFLFIYYRMNITSLFLSVSLALLMKVINGYDEIINTNEEFTSDRYRYVESPDTWNNGWNTYFIDVSDEKGYDKETSDGGDHGKKIEIVVRQTTNDAQNQDDVKAFPKMRNCNGIGSKNRHGGRASAKKTSQENKFKLDGNTANDKPDFGSYSRSKLWKRAVKLSVNNGLWVLSNMMGETAKNKNKMAAMRKPKVVKMKLKSSMLHRLLSRNIRHNNVLLRFWLFKVGR